VAPEDQQQEQPEPRPDPLGACYRHPDERTGVRCNRCERPICVSCMHQAAVGFQCPECVQAGRESVRQPTTRYGGQLFGDTALVTKALIGVNALVFLLGMGFALGGSFVDELVLVRGPALESMFSAQQIGVAVGPEQWYRMVSAMFLHEQVWHIAMNMLALWVVGPQLEALLGRGRFLGLYLAGGLGGASLFVLTAAPNAASLGASGAIFGLFGAMLVLAKRQHFDLKPIAGLIVVNLLITFVFRDAIDWRGHVGGLVVGSLVAAGLVYAPREHRKLVQGATLLAALAVAVSSAVLA
jgi:membrane associated rhomboid family serine protease